MPIERNGGCEMRLIDTDIEEVDRRYGEQETFSWKPFLPGEIAEFIEVDDVPPRGQNGNSEPVDAPYEYLPED
jgi:hypothetical protein